jgi:5-methylthioribose kinase
VSPAEFGWGTRSLAGPFRTDVGTVLTKLYFDEYCQTYKHNQNKE